MNKLKALLAIGILLVFASILTVNIYILGVAELVTIPTIVLLIIKNFNKKK